jgi:hypothetical protein
MNAYPSIPLQTTLGPVTVHVYGGGEVTITIPPESPHTINRIAYHGRYYCQMLPDSCGRRRLTSVRRSLERTDGSWGGVTDNAAGRLYTEVILLVEKRLQDTPHLFVQAEIADLEAKIERARRDMAKLERSIQALQDQKWRLQEQLAIEEDP